MAAVASVVGCPSRPTAQPRGMSSPLRFATSTLPSATALVAMSSTNGARPPVGAASAIGLVPSAGFFARVGTTMGDVFVQDIPMKSSRSAIIA